jgi:hypothetical protein
MLARVRGFRRVYALHNEVHSLRKVGPAGSGEDRGMGVAPRADDTTRGRLWLTLQSAVAP